MCDHRDLIWKLRNEFCKCYCPYLVYSDHFIQVRSTYCCGVSTVIPTASVAHQAVSQIWYITRYIFLPRIELHSSNHEARNSFSSSFFVSFCSMHDVSWLIFRNHILNDAGGYNGVKDGYPIPPGTDLFISVSLFHCLFLFGATIILIPISLIEHRVDCSTLLPVAGV